MAVWVISRPLAQVRGVSRLEGEELAGGRVGPGRGIGEGEIGQAIIQATVRRVRREQGGIDMIENESVETLERDVHSGRLLEERGSFRRDRIYQEWKLSQLRLFS